ncbi:MAG: hypothetical protein AB1753_10745 [Thermoproteota archaeon]
MSVWSDWLDFDRAGVEQVPEKPGVYLMHASMKVMHIGGSDNMRQALLDLLADPCAGKARRFHYMPTESYAQVREQMLKEYADKHGGKLPSCMEGEEDRK